MKYLFISLILISCSFNPQDSIEKPALLRCTKQELIFCQELLLAFQSLYPETIRIESTEYSTALLEALYLDSAQLIFTDFLPDAFEIKNFEQKNIFIQSINLAKTPWVLFKEKNNPISFLTPKKIIYLADSHQLAGLSSEINWSFQSSFNCLADTLSNLDQLLNYVQQHKSIGVVSFPVYQSIIKKNPNFVGLPVQFHADSASFLPTLENVQTNNYTFTKNIYLLYRKNAKALKLASYLAGYEGQILLLNANFLPNKMPTRTIFIHH